MYAKIIEAASSGSDVNIYACTGNVSCQANPLGLISQCKSCVSQTKKYIQIVEKKIRNAKINYIDYRNFSYKIEDISFKSIKNWSYDNTDSGYATLSTYIDHTRDHLARDKNPFSQFLLKTISLGYVNTYEMAGSILNNEDANSIIHVFNGRLTSSRAVLRAGRKNGFEVDIIEYIKGTSRIESFRNTLPHNIYEINKRIEQAYVENKYKLKDLAGKFYGAKADGLSIFDRSYTNKQIPGTVPEGWSSQKFKVVLFTSSEDEFQAIGKEWDDKLFIDQIEGIRHIAKILEKDVKLYARIHPNVANANRKYLKQIEILKSVENINIISPSSKISSYQLLFDADLVVSFGSTIGIEAAYYGKISLVLGPSFYTELDSVYRPKSIAELDNMLFNLKSLRPKPAFGAEKYALFCMVRGYEIEQFALTHDGKFKVDGGIVDYKKLRDIRYVFAKIIKKSFCYIAGI